LARGIGSTTHSHGTMAEGEWHRFLSDALGNTIELLNPNATVRQETLYDAFGKVLASTNLAINSRLRNTKERDVNIGLDNDGFRYYDPDTGTYIQRDPIGYADGLNVYMSVHDDPINHVDPEGLSVSDAVSWVADKAIARFTQAVVSEAAEVSTAVRTEVADQATQFLKSANQLATTY